MENQNRHDAVRRYQRLSIVCSVVIIISGLLALTVNAWALVFGVLVICVAIANSYFATQYVEAQRPVVAGEHNRLS